MWNQFRSRLLFSFGGVFILWALALAVFFARGMGAEQLAYQGESLRLTSQMAATLLSEQIKERATEIDLLRRSPLFVEGDLGSTAVRQALELRRASQEQYLWLGVAGTDGIVLQGTESILVGESVKARPWFEGAKKGPYSGDVHPAVLLEKKLLVPVSDEPLRFVDFASPIVGKNGELRGILAAHASWGLVTHAIQLRVLPVLGREFSEMLIINQEGQVIYPQKWAGTLAVPNFPKDDARAKAVVWPDGVTWLTSVTSVKNASQSNLNWRVVIREPYSGVVLRVREFQIQRITATLVASLALLLAFYGLATWHSRPLHRLARFAAQLQGQWPGQAAAPTRTGREPEEEQIAMLLSDVQTLLDLQAQEAKAREDKLQAQVQLQSAALIQSNVKLTEQVTRDVLTGLKNRRELDARLADAAEQARHSDQKYAILFLDLDHFKRVNDEHGHDVGDAVLQKLAQILLENSRASDVVARYGGEEFVILLPDIDDSQVAIKVAEKIRLAVAAAQFPGVGHLTLSVGVACAGAQDTQGATVLKRADEAVYVAKTTGRNKVHFQGPEAAANALG